LNSDLTKNNPPPQADKFSCAPNWLILAAFTLTPWLCRALLFSNGISREVNQLLWGMASDLFWAGLLSAAVLSLRHARPLITGLLFLLWNLTHIMDVENILALGQLMHHSNLPYLLNAEFLGNTVNALPAVKILLNASIFALALTALKFGFQSRASLRGQALLVTLGVLMASGVLLYQTLPASQERWQSRNFFALHLDVMAAEALQKLHATPKPKASSSHPLFAEDLNAPRPDIGQAKNVLIITLEGITGAYIKSVTDYLNYPAPLTMPTLSALAKQALVVPNFVSHRNQTNRGLYSMLCSDYPKLLNDTAKPMEILSNDSAAERCLPQVLRKHGYSTHYFQAASLQFMSKGTVMPFIGFDDVRGKEAFELPADYYFNWGPDDKLFFDQSLEWLRALKQQEAPWFATLLTVGTHHPYAIDPKASKLAPKLASVLAADKALATLIKGIRKAGIDDDTLILITSDESHGVQDFPFGNNWGFIMALAPDISPALSDDVFGSVDTSLSVLDYLNIVDERPEMTGRSIFRDYSDERDMPFSQWSTLALSEKKDHIILCPQQAQSFLQQLLGTAPCRHLRSENTQLFSSTYSDIPQADHTKDQPVYLMQQALDSRLQQKTNSKRSIVFNKNTHIALGKNRSADLLSGQFLSLPHQSNVSLVLDLSFQGDPEAHLSLDLRSTDLKKEQNGTSFLAPIALPSLKSGERFKLNLGFSTLNAFGHGQTILRGMSHDGAGNVLIHSYKVHIEKNNQAYTRAMRLNSASITQIEASLEPVKASQPQQNNTPPKSLLRLSRRENGKHYSLARAKALPQDGSIDFHNTQTLLEHGASGFWPAETWGSWSKGQASVNIMAPKPHGPMTLRVRAHAMLPPTAYEMPTAVFVNQHKVATWHVRGHPLEYAVQIPEDILLDKNSEIRFELQQPLTSPHDLNALSGDHRKLGLAIRSFTLLPEM